ncbi:MAG: hypothetical protein A2W91_02700 [Bacteroidetes bacterium GWF2_38_335]|nr:MAG: hypothetical protein A2W91_02700 [Bacteroidetes bacterium GWF2_38_335]OFY77596.1 MAG: hypothetical protein A2281_02060 [Bacteroidetes bacterium RIFOXYA12_FULL_38_20]HBS87102.1 hypothetical protein [Bacteroidales bacterium]
MSKNIGLIKIKGKIGDMTFYNRKGKNIVKLANDVDKSRILKDPAYKRTRENMAEFGGSATIGKSFRLGFGMFARRFGGDNLIGRVVAIMHAIIARGAGKRGERSYNVVANKDLLEGFEFNSKDKLQNFFNAPYSISANAGRNEVTLVVPEFSTDAWMTAPEGASHFKLICAIAVLSDFTKVPTSKKYEPVNPSVNELSAFAMSPEIPLGGTSGSELNLVASLPGLPVIAASAGVISTVAIEFYQEINSELFLLATDNAMRVVKVF